MCLRVLAYFLASLLGAPQNISLAQLTHALRRRATFAELIDEHFHLDFGGNAAIMRI
ncbi:MAG: hypothetical protein L0312_19915 [Acidobacteria bacterium]|nr:hypothetical protein [Acidobacteriota bacterium]